MSFLQVVSTIASIISIPLAVYYAHKTADATSDKARLEILKTLSYKLSIGTLTYDDITSVYCSKLREHRIKKAEFGITDIIHDLKSDIMSNAFIEIHTRSDMLLNLSQISSEREEAFAHESSNKGAYLYQKCILPLLIPVLIVLIIGNVVLLLLSFPYFVLLLEQTFHFFYSPSGYYRLADLVFDWEDFFYFSKLFISVPCLVAWSILIVAHKYISAKGRHL